MDNLRIDPDILTWSYFLLEKVWQNSLMPDV